MLRRAGRRLPLRQIRVYKDHRAVDAFARAVGKRRTLAAADRHLFATLVQAMRTEHDAALFSHFSRASSDMTMLRLLKDLVSLEQPSRILEIGTGYGMSAIALSRHPGRPEVLTVENDQARHDLARANIAKAGADRVTCLRADKLAALNDLIERGERFDFVFHDGGHRGDDYVRDMELLRRLVRSGGLIVIDDIAWDRSETNRARTQDVSRLTCLEGWSIIANQDGVAWSLSISGRVGVLRLA